MHTLTQSEMCCAKCKAENWNAGMAAYLKSILKPAVALSAHTPPPFQPLTNPNPPQIEIVWAYLKMWHKLDKQATSLLKWIYFPSMDTDIED